MNQSTSISDTSLVMVAVIPSTRDLDIARLLGWYRIPLKSAPKIIAVDYLAFYQTSAFPKDEQGQIRWFHGRNSMGNTLSNCVEILGVCP